MRAGHDELIRRWGRGGDAVYTALAGGASLLLIGLLAGWSGQSLLFASLGPTAFLVFETPLADNASPRSTVGAHLVAIAAGWLSLALFGLLAAPHVLEAGVDGARASAAALSMALTGGGVVLLRVKHPPAGATTLLVSLGFMRDPPALLAMGIGVGVLTLFGFLVNRAFGLPVPGWAPRHQPTTPS
jgi:CBS domain-containing membrane protein